MATCQITPKIPSKDGKKHVDSKLFNDLYNVFRNREWVKRVYYGVHTDYFIDWFGDWIKDPENSSIVVDENGEPKIVMMYSDFEAQKIPVFVKSTNEEFLSKLADSNYELDEELAPSAFMPIYDSAGGTVDISIQPKNYVSNEIQAAVDKYGAGNINKESNPLVWAEEDKLGLINTEREWYTDERGTRRRRFKELSYAKAMKLAKEARADDFQAMVAKTNSGKYIVRLAKDISQLTSSANRIVERVQAVADIKEDLRERFGVIMEQEEKLSDIEKLHKKVTEAFETRLAIMEKQYNFIQRHDFQNFLEEYKEAGAATSAMVSAINYSAKITDQLFKRYQKVLKDKKPFTAEILQTWSDFLVAYDVLDDLQTMLAEDPSIIQDPSLIEKLDVAIKKKNILKTTYTKKGLPLMAKWLSQFYNGIRVKFEEDKRSEYRKEYHRQKKGREVNEEVLKYKTEKEYVEAMVAKHKGELDQKTENLLLGELEEASRDVNVFTRWLDNMLDTADPVAAAVVNAFTRAEEDSRIEALEKRVEVLGWLTKLEEARGKGNFQSELDFYKFALEFDRDGISTQYLLKPWMSDLIAEEQRQRDRIFKRGEAEDPTFLDDLQRKLDVGEIDRETFQRKRRAAMESAFYSWRENTLRVDEDTKWDHLLTYFKNMVGKMDDQTGEVLVTEEDFEAIRLHPNMSPSTMVREGLISEEVGNLYMSWNSKNYWTYTNIIDEWRNPQWDKLMREVGIATDIPYFRQSQQLRKSDHHLAQAYIAITDLAEEADSKIPYSYRLGGRLPGVSKILSERFKDKQNPTLIAKNTIRADFVVRPEDVERGEQILTDEQGRPKMFLPIHFTNHIELENQSFDLAGIYFKFWESTNDYSIKRKILPEIEMARYFISNRKALKRNSLGDIVISKIGLKGKGNFDELDENRVKPSTEEKTRLAEQLNDWFEMAVYGKKAKENTLWHVSDDLVVDGAKFVDAINRYTSLNLLGFNIVQGVANVAIGETMEAIDAFAGEHVSIKTLNKATGKYMKWLPRMMGDWGARTPSHVGSLIIEHFGILHEPVTDVAFSKKTKVGQHFDMGTLFMMQKAGEHWMQSRFLYALLMEKRAINDAGEDIGNMLDQYYADKGELKIKKEVNLEKSKWTKTDQDSFLIKAKGLLSRMHGEYSDLGRVAIQRMAIGRMAYMFRKFVVPGLRRRWAKSRYIERLGQTVEGNYITTLRFVRSLSKDLKVFKMSLMSDDWAALSDHEKANIRRTLGEVVALVGATIMANFLYKKAQHEDDEEWLYAYWSYQAYRLQTELLFFTPKLDEAMTILRSPAASVSMVDNVIKLIDQMFSPLERYERGPWKGEYKMKKILINFAPLYKQYYKARDVEEQISWFRN